MQALAALVAALTGAGAGFWMASRAQTRYRMLKSIGQALEEITLGAVRFKQPLSELIQKARSPVPEIWRDGKDAQDTPLTEADAALLSQLLSRLARMDAQNCPDVCQGVCQSWQAHLQDVGAQVEKDVRLWRVLCTCAGVALGILML